MVTRLDVYLTFSLLAGAGCSATFVDARPPMVDLAGEPAATDFAAPPSGELGESADLSVTEHVIASGTFEGRAGHTGEGPVDLFMRSDGSVQVRFLDGYRSSAAPGPVVVLSSRDALGTKIDTSLGDRELGIPQPTGAQTFAVPGGDQGQRVVFIFCKPFGTEIARARLSP